MVAVYNRWALMQVLLALACLTKLSYGFNAATPSSLSVQVAPSAAVRTPTASAPYNKWLDSSSSRKCSSRLQAHHEDSTTHLVGNSFCISGSSRSSGLFHQRQQHHMMHTTSRLQMTTNSENTNNDMSSDNNSSRNPLVRIWLKLRVFIARLLVSSRSYTTS